MKYIRVVLAVEDEDIEELADQLDVFIEDPANNPIVGAYVSDWYVDRKQALYGLWKDPVNDTLPTSH